MAIKYNGSTISFSFIVYVLVSSNAGLMIIQYLFKNNKSLAAMIVLVLLLLVFIFYGLRWFSNFQLKGSAPWVAQTAKTANGSSGSCGATTADAASPVNANWPPIVNVCPDYMVSQNGKCIDPKQLYGNKGGGNGSTSTSIAIGDKTCGNYAIDYLRWEGVVESDGQCINGKIPSS